MSKFTGSATIFSGRPPIVDEANPTHALGDVMHTSDGREYRYVLAGASNLVVGNLIQGPAQDTANQSVVVAAAAIDATSVTTTGNVTVTANEYAGGYVVVTGEAGTGRGEVYKIKSHPAATAAVVTLTLEDPITTALSATTQIDLVKNPYSGVIQYPTTASGAVVGVAVNNITAARYGWIQTRGIAAVLADGALTVGGTVVASNNTAGAVEDGADATDLQAIVGVAATGVATTENGAVFLTIS
jgi:hypothetical protein